MQATTFVEDWLCYNTTLGEGAYGEVKLLIHRRTEEKIACKIINHQRYKDAATNINREVTIHRMLDHENIIKYFGRRQEPLKEYIFLEYASGGELFQLIEPDIGMASHAAQTYMKQLMHGVNYLHNKGITHRDIKPENLLIGEGGVLKISDFGMATLFRYKGKERLLDKKCGTKPYLAPEVLQKPYRAQPSDLWSCGIVFVAMLTGELPWADATDRNVEFAKWRKDVYISETPWSKLGNTALSLARQILNLDPNKRLTLEQIEKHPWMKFNFDCGSSKDNVDGSVERPTKRWNSMVEAETKHNRDTPQVTLSQPIITYRPSSIDQLINDLKTTRREQVCFSQPTQYEDLMIQFTQSPITKDNFHNLSKRMTRFYVTVSYEKTLEALCSVLDTLHYSWTTDASGAVTISTVDFMKNQLIFKANLFEMDGRILLDFRLSKGCGLEFKKKFLKLKSCLCDIIDK
ncbi:serine/threonine-protein kinase grp [Anoplophora glabripennis]|uniref:serine/threonine-protein kinase grp n=1 Tax=Anoplophora glabripennis TaxID=217634 RepID=UPI000874C334|nr:serine/threonine-protein kinase grp [Anoplophora glabripennis]